MLDFTKGSKPKSNRVKFEMSDTITLVVDDEYCKIYNDTRSGKPFKVINDEVVPIELKELNMWKNRQKHPENFTVEVINDENGKVYDYLISRVSAPGANASTAPNAPVQQAAAPRRTPPTPVQPAAASRPTPPPTPVQPAAASRPTPPPPAPKAQSSNGGGTTIRTDSTPRPSRIKFESTPTTELVLENEFFKIYKDTRSGKTFKVIDNEVAPIELRELNMWKNRQRNQGGFTVEIVKDLNNEIYDYNISRASEQQTPVNKTEPVVAAPKVQVPPDTVINAEPSAVSAKVNSALSSSAAAKEAPVPAIPVSNKINPDKQTSNKSSANKSKNSIQSVTNTVGTAPTDRVKFEETPTTQVVVENEFCKIYKNTRSGKTFKVINGMIAPIELRELNMWKNRQKNKSNFTVEIMKDESGVPFDYIISRINEDGTLTKAPAVAPVAPYIPPENEYVPTTMLTASENKSKKATPAKPSEVFPVGKPSGALPAKEAAEKVSAPVDRVKFEESPTMYVVLENEFFKIYNDPRRGKTFKVIEGKIVPIELRELNMWKNRQRKAKNFAVEIVRTESGEIYDYNISRTENSTTAAVESTSTKTNMPPVTVLNSNASAKKRRQITSRVLKCAICGDEYSESELLLFDNRNFCSSCVEELIKEKLDFKPVDPIQKVINDVVAADELYCTYSTVTNYPYLDEEFCVNVCTVKKAAEILEDDTAVQTIDDKGLFFDDLKRFGLKKIIVNGDSSNIYEPEDFDEHLKTEGVIAPKLYFKILNFMQRKDDELRERIAASFIESKVLTYALNDEITEITEENIEDFKPLIITDGHAKFCPVFTDFSEAKSVGMPFRGLFEIDADLLSKYDITHYIINPSSLGFIMNKSILKPFIDEDDFKPVEKVTDEVISEFEEPKEEKTVSEPVAPEVNENVPEPAPEEKAPETTAPQSYQPFEPVKPIEIVKPDEPEAKEIIPEQKTEVIPENKPFEDEMIQNAKAKFEKIFAPVKVEETVPEPQVNAPKSFTPEPSAPSAEPFSFELGSKTATEPTPEQPKQQSFTESFFGQSADSAQTTGFASQPTTVGNQFFSQPTQPTTARPTAQTSPVGNQFYSQPAPSVPTQQNSPAASQFYAQPAQSTPPQPSSPVASQFYSQPTPPAPTKPPVAQTPPPTQRRAVNASDIVIKSNNTDGSKKTFKVSTPIFIPDDPNADIETSTSEPSALQKAIRKSQAMFEDNSGSFGSSEPAPSVPDNTSNANNFTFSDIMNGFEVGDDNGGGLDLSSILGQNEEPPAQPEKPKLTIQLQATEAKVIARDLEVEPDVRVAQILRDQLNESYRKLSKMIAEADVIYAEYDSNTKHILIDGNNKGHIFSEKMYADKSVENFAKNGIGVYIKEYKNEELFTMLYEYKRHGIQDLVLDETANWVIISTDRIADMLDVNERKFVPIPVSNPELMFSMTTLFQKLQSKNDNPKRKQEIQSLEKLMIREFTSARYILPMVSYDGGDVKPLSIDGKNGVKRILVFSDAFEMKRFFGDKISIVKDYEIVTYKELIKKFTVMANTVVVLNEGSLRFEFNEHNCDHINKVINQ